MHKKRRASLLLMTTLLLATTAAVCSSALAQSSNSDWQLLGPEGEEFTIMMPKDPKFEESKEPYHRDMTLNTRLYLSAPARGPVLAVVSLSGIKSNAAAYSDFLRLNSYVDAFKNWFPQKVRGKDAVGRLTLLSEKTLNGNVGREYRLVIGDLSGTARVFATRRRFYAAVILNTKKDDELTEQFLSSFMLPEKMAPQPAVVAANPGAADSGANRKPAPNKESGEEGAKTEATIDANTETKPADADASAAKKPGERAPINGGILNGKAISLPQPDYPPIAQQANAAGTVLVQVVIDETGNVISAHATSGHPLLQAASVSAARQAKFAPTSLMGEPVKVSGVLSYNFVGK